MQEKGAKRYTDSSEKYSRDVEPLASDKTKAVVQQTEIDLATEELSNESNQSELFLIDLDTVIGENSNLLHTLTQHESIDNALNLATKIDFINSAVEVKTMTDESSAPSTQSHNEKLKENTEEPIKSDFDLEEQNDKYVPEYAEYDRKSNSLKQDTKSGTAIREGQSENPQATVSNKNRNLSDELFTLDNQSLSQHATKDAGIGNDLLKEITLGFFEARKGYLKSKTKSSSVVKQESLNKMMKRFFSSSQPGQHQISSCSTVTSRPPDTSLTCTQGKPDIEKDIEDNVRPLKIEELDSHKDGSTLHLSRHLDICLEQVSSSRRTLDLHQSGTLIGSASRLVETGEEDHDIAETETTVIAQKYENHESEDGKYDKNHNKENKANRYLICEFDDTETEADSDVFDIDLLRLDRTENGHRQLSNEQTRPSKTENTNFQEKQKCRTDEIVPDSNSDSEDDDEPDKMWLNFQFGKYAMVQDKGSRDSTIGGQADNPRNASTQHTTMHCNATSNTNPKGDEQTDSHSTFLQNINDSPNRSEAQKTCVTDTSVPFKERNALTSRLSLSKQFSSMKGIKPMSPGSSFKTNKCTATDDVNDNRSSPVQDDENDVLIPETPSHVRRQTNSVLTFDQEVNSINLSKRKESVDFAGESDQSTKARKETVAMKMKEGEIIRR